MVVEANGIESPASVGAEKLMVRPEPPTSAPVPESEMAVPATGDDVATLCIAPVPAPYNSEPDANVVAPVPPRLTPSEPVVSESATPRDEVAICVTVFPAPPMSSWLFVIDVSPVPPCVAPSVPEMFESVVVATHVGTPETSVRTWPFTPAVVVATAPVPLPSTRLFA